MGGPYIPHTPMLGGSPTKSVDDPICAVLLPFFAASAAINLTIFLTNKKHGHEFVLSMPLFGFSLARVVTLALRIAWAGAPANANVIVAASVFTNAGVMVLFMVNIILTQRIVRAKHPKFGWSKPVTFVFRLLLFFVIAMLFMVVPATVYSFFTLSRKALLQIRDVQRFAGTFLAVLAMLPVLVIATALLVPNTEKLDKFGSGRWRTKVLMVLFTALLLSFGAWFRIAVNFATGTKYEWFHHKAIFYTVNFAIELIVVYTYIIMRFDRRFHTPPGASAPGHYRGGLPPAVNISGGNGERDAEKESGEEEADMSDWTVLGRVETEEEMFGGTERPKEIREEGKTGGRREGSVCV